MEGIVHQIHVKPKTLNHRGMPKISVDYARVLHSGMVGDFNVYRQEKLSGTLDKALLLMPLEMIESLNGEGWPIKPGDIGENITTHGIQYGDFSPGQRYDIGEIEIKISETCAPCGSLKLLPYVGENKKVEFVKIMLDRRGWYAEVLREGRINVGDLIKRIE